MWSSCNIEHCIKIFKEPYLPGKEEVEDLRLSSVLHHLCPAFNPLTSQLLSSPSQISSRCSLSLEVWNESEWVEWALALAAINIPPSVVCFKLLLYLATICTICSSWWSDHSTSSLEVWSPRCPWHLWTVVVTDVYSASPEYRRSTVRHARTSLSLDLFLPDPKWQQFWLTNQGQILPANPSLTGLMTLDRHYVNLKNIGTLPFRIERAQETTCLSFF